MRGCCLHFEAQRRLVFGLLGELGADELGDLQGLILGSSLADEAADYCQDALQIYSKHTATKKKKALFKNSFQDLFG